MAHTAHLARCFILLAISITAAFGSIQVENAQYTPVITSPHIPLITPGPSAENIPIPHIQSPETKLVESNNRNVADPPWGNGYPPFITISPGPKANNNNEPECKSNRSLLTKMITNCVAWYSKSREGKEFDTKRPYCGVQAGYCVTTSFRGYADQYPAYAYLSSAGGRQPGPGPSRPWTPASRSSNPDDGWVWETPAPESPPETITIYVTERR